MYVAPSPSHMIWLEPVANRTEPENAICAATEQHALKVTVEGGTGSQKRHRSEERSLDEPIIAKQV